MRFRKLILVCCIGCGSIGGVYAQTGTRSPYSRYGYGELEPQAFSDARSMGGLGYGIRTKRFINSMNPASYSAMDSLTFMMDMGVSGMVESFETNIGTSNTFVGNLDYVAFQLPLYKSLAISFGLLPYTEVGYAYSSESQNEDYEGGDLLTVRQEFQGNGGFTQVYLGLSYDILNRVAVGVNGRYMFGKVEHSRQVTFPDEGASLFKKTTQTVTMDASAWLCDVGVQYHQPIQDHEFVLGASYSFKLPMNMTTCVETTTNTTKKDDTFYYFDFPQTVGAGVSYRMGEMLLVGFDVCWQNFASARYFGCTDSLNNRMRYALGAEFVPKYGSKNYTDNMRYRVGASYANSYARVGGKDYNEFTVSVGIGFPLTTAMTHLNVLLLYGQRGSVASTGLTDRYFKIGVDVSLNERWFVKRRFN